MRSLLDVNVLIALFDADHTLHESALRWFDANAREGWATCPLTQNGFLRVMAQPGYQNPLPVNAVAARLREAAAHPHHEFWADDVTILDERAVDTTRIHGPKQLTDVYLLSLAVSRNGRLVTFDRSLPLAAVVKAQKKHLLVI
jgi:toxin-antitoxin system PIN domain toxin